MIAETRLASGAISAGHRHASSYYSLSNSLNAYKKPSTSRTNLKYPSIALL